MELDYINLGKRIAQRRKQAKMKQTALADLVGNMYSRHVPQNIIDGLQLCTEEDIALLSVIMQYLVERRHLNWNSDNFA